LEWLLFELLQGLPVWQVTSAELTDPLLLLLLVLLSVLLWVAVCAAWQAKKGH
jgi:hypothetical protein